MDGELAGSSSPMLDPQSATNAALAHYDGLIHATARLCVSNSEEDFEDLVQILSIKAWKAICAFDQAKCRTSRDKYVFMCVRDGAKDIVKKVKRYDVYVEDVCTPATREHFEARYLRSREDPYAAINDDEDLLGELNELERKIVTLLLDDYQQMEVVKLLDLEKVDMDRAMKSIRAKLIDLRPLRPANVIDLFNLFDFVLPPAALAATG